MIEIRSEPGVAVRPSARPEAFRFARYMAEKGHTEITSADHRSVNFPDPISRGFLQKLDGLRDRDTLASEMNCSAEELDARLEALARYSMLVA